MTTNLGAQWVSNPLRVPDEQQPVAATRYYLVLLPRLGYAPSTDRAVWLDGAFSRDRYDPSHEADDEQRRRIANEEITFAQLTGRYEQLLDGGDSWGTGLGYSWLRQGEPDADLWRRMGEEDGFLNVAYRFALGGADWAAFRMELRAQDLTYTFDLPDYNEDANVITLGGQYEAAFGSYQAGIRLNLARYDAIGRFARKKLLDGGAHIARQLGPILADLGWNAVAERFRELNSDLGDIRLRQTLRIWTLDLTWPVTKSITLAGEVRSDERTANVPSAEYHNEALNLSVIHVY